MIFQPIEDDADLEDKYVPLLDSTIKPKLDTWKSGKGREYKRAAIINSLTKAYLTEIKSNYRDSEDKAALQFYNLIKKGFATDDEADGWENLMSEIGSTLASKGTDWDNPAKQQEDIHDKKKWAFRAKVCEIFYALSTAIMAAYSLLELPLPALAPYLAFLGFQVPWVAFINYMGIDPDDVPEMIAPGILIGTKKVIGFDVSEYDETKDKSLIHAKLTWDSSFDPTSEDFNEEKLRFFNRVLTSWLQRKTKFQKSTFLTEVNRFFNSLTFPVSNFLGAVQNGLVAMQVSLFLQQWLKSYCSENVYCERSIEATLFAMLPVPMYYLGRAGIEFYELFTTKSIELNGKTFFTSDNPLAITYDINPSGGFEAGLQFSSNVAARGFTFGEGLADLIETTAKCVPSYYNFNIKDYPKLRNASLGIGGVAGGHNTFGSRMKGAQEYKKPVDFKGPCGQLDLTAPDIKLFENEIKNITLKNGEKARIYFWSTFHGLSWGVPLGLGLYLMDLSMPVYASSSLALTAVRFLVNAFAEQNHLTLNKARKMVDERIKSHTAKIQLKINDLNDLNGMKRAVNEVITRGTYDINGNLQLTEKDLNNLNLFSCAIDQLQRMLGRGGSVGSLLGSSATVVMVLMLGLMCSLAFVTPQICEFATYSNSTLPVLIKTVNNIREVAGTPLSKIRDKGFSEKAFHFWSRQFAFFFPCIIEKGKPIAGISDQNICTWIMGGWWKYEHPTVSSHSTFVIPPENTGCLSRFRERFLGRAVRSSVAPMYNGFSPSPNLI